MKNPVAKNMNEFNKPRTYRNRKTVAKDSGDYKEHHRLAPYKRGSATNLLLEWEDDEPFDSMEDLGDDEWDPTLDGIDGNGRCDDPGCPCHEGALDYEDE